MQGLDLNVAILEMVRATSIRKGAGVIAGKPVNR
jgi:VIT1/CCC1 family predicted Fe2+/Mn2+ transporter